MKKLTLFFMTFLMLLSSFSVVAFANTKDDEELFSNEQIEYYKNLNLQGTTINVYNWGEYISDGSEDSLDVVSEFERLTGAKVNYTNYESNENMYSKLSGGGVSYDVVIPSDYMVSRLINEGLLNEIDFNNIPNSKYLKDDYKNLYYDKEGKYSICYNVGTTVLIYNKKLVDEVPDSWDILWNEKYKDQILMFNNSRDAFAIAHAMLGQSYNTNDEEEWQKAAELLAKQKDAVNPVYVMDEVFNFMESGDYALAPYYAGDYVLMCQNNPDLGYCFPKEGVNNFYDAFCIPKCAKNIEGAEAFINFMYEPQVALANSEFINYASPNVSVINNKDYALYGNQAVYPSEKPYGESFENLPKETMEIQSDLWTKVKSGQLSQDSIQRKKRIYIEFGILSAIIVVGLILKCIFDFRKNKFEDLSDLYD